MPSRPPSLHVTRRDWDRMLGIFGLSNISSVHNAIISILDPALWVRRHDKRARFSFFSGNKTQWSWCTRSVVKCTFIYCCDDVIASKQNTSTSFASVPAAPRDRRPTPLGTHYTRKTYSCHIRYTRRTIANLRCSSTCAEHLQRPPRNKYRTPRTVYKGAAAGCRAPFL